MLTPFRRHLLIVILAVTSIVMSLLVVQQGHTIDSQRTLIKQLFQDSLELTTIKIQRAHQPNRTR